MLLNRYGDWAVTRDIWLSVAYIPGDSNVVADFHSHCFHENKEWALKDAVVALLPTAYVSPVIDLFASSAKVKLPRYISLVAGPACLCSGCLYCFLAGLNLL